MSIIASDMDYRLRERSAGNASVRGTALGRCDFCRRPEARNDALPMHRGDGPAGAGREGFFGGIR